MKREQGYWIPVTKSLPLEPEQVLVLTTSGAIKICYWHKGKWENDGPGTLEGSGYEAEYWQPLPAMPQQNKQKRASGFYWVKYDGEWFIAYYDYTGWKSAWSVLPFAEKEFEEINETRLTSPAESQGENKQ